MKTKSVTPSKITDWKRAFNVGMVFVGKLNLDCSHICLTVRAHFCKAPNRASQSDFEIFWEVHWIMNCLFILPKPQALHQELFRSLREDQIPFEVIHDTMGGIEMTRMRHFDVIVLKANSERLQVEQTIRLLKGCDPTAKVIVTTAANSKSLEAKIRKQNIYYFHLESFGTQDLRLAIQTACRNSNNSAFSAGCCDKQGN